MKLTGKIALVTGASSGIGRSVAEQLASQGARLILAARRVERLQSLADSLKNEHGTDVLVIPLDVQDQAAVKQTIESLPDEWAAIDILINNAGLALASEPFHNCDIEQWNTMLDTNVKGVLCVTHAVVQGMVQRNSGHIVNVGSIAGRQAYPGGNVYCASKYAVKAISRSLRIDLSGYAIRVSEIAPGAVDTEFSVVRWDDKDRADQFYADFHPLVADDVAETILFCVTRPPHVNVSELVVYPTDQANATTINKHS
jgi:hypothetical protein